MSNQEEDSSDEEYYPASIKIRNSCPTKNSSFPQKPFNDKPPFASDSHDGPKLPTKQRPRPAHGTEPAFRTGRWSAEEHKKFLEAIEIHGRDWK